ncbi:polysaccharide pyruvyl transferase family protein [Microbacterium oryzae]|uniref:glycosyltransferase n=1 Tax=Microbacterium oryzae TaxID=743009 RepID=UPI0025B19039|nr:polysaccharide pyruvyl transferase family protein [Microbacterium oryzae]MDN3310448.1 polysaccharide pyruvyl transferase family protein [Microbacterium oryzae]
MLETVAAPGHTIKYIDQVVRYAPNDVTFTYFSWKQALFGRYDVLHVHWPEFLMRSGRPWFRILQRQLVRALLLRVRVLRTPVVRTQHNREPHEPGDAKERALLRKLDELTTDRVFLSAAMNATDLPGTRYVVPHGDYREELGSHPTSSAVRGRLVFFGRIEPYKSVPHLIDVFEAVASEGDELRVVGRPTEPVKQEILDRVAAWQRTDATVRLRLEHVADVDMVEEISSAEAVVLPYSEMNNSGVVLVALSLSRPVIVPASETNQTIADEVGEGWVIQYEGEFSEQNLREALATARRPRSVAPDLAARSWRTVASSYADVFRTAASTRAAAKRRVYVNAGGQRDNIGDSLLRRAYLDALRAAGELHAYAGPDRGYSSGLGMRPEDVEYASPRKWLVQAALSTLMRPGTAVAFNTGEVVGTREEYQKGRWQPGLARLAKFFRRRLVLTGVSVRPGSSPELTSLRTLSSVSDVVTWRDEWSRDQFGRGEVQPDWAFSLGSSPDQWLAEDERKTLAVAMRGDRPLPEDGWFEAVRAIADQRGLSITVAVQVLRDADRAAELAERLGADVLGWEPSVSHAEQERRIRALYGSSVGVISDRIHALIVGYTEGAVPLGFSTDSPEKVVRSLEPTTTRAFFGMPGEWRSVWESALDARAGFTADLVSARTRLEAVAERIVGTLRQR